MSPSPDADISNIFTFTVPESDKPSRLDQCLTRLAQDLPGLSLSRTYLQQIITDGYVRLNDTPVTEVSHRVHPGQILQFTLPPAEPFLPEGEDIPLTILYEDQDIIVIDKPAGLVVHPSRGHPTGTLVNALIAHCGASLSGIGGVQRPGIVHRLDKDTSGIMVVAKNDLAHHGLAKLFADHGRSHPFERAYLALVWGVLSRGHGTMDAPIGRHHANPLKNAVVTHDHGKEAITHWKVLQAFADSALVQCNLETGRTHQIRVHMAHMGHPVIGDPLYAAGFKTKNNLLNIETKEALETLGRQALHATRLSFPHPRTGEMLIFNSELPEDMQRLVDLFK